MNRTDYQRSVTLRHILGDAEVLNADEVDALTRAIEVLSALPGVIRQLGYFDQTRVGI